MTDAHKISETLRQLGVRLPGDLVVEDHYPEEPWHTKIHGVFMTAGGDKKYFASIVPTDKIQSETFLAQWCAETAARLALQDRDHA